MALQNENPTIYESSAPTRAPRETDEDEAFGDLFDAQEIFDLIRNINDPEHPLTLEQLNVTQMRLIDVDDARSHVTVRFTPTIPHCSMATLIGLCIRVRLLRALPPRFKVRVLITEGTHNSEAAVNKQLNDKERVAAALESVSLASVVNQCLSSTLVS
ncbi:mitotic spindle-associated MMXD complex subunit MIP18-like protein [Blastocladiella britannica]|nr:mitotic spindle-associated MMXD complex subunit MIP18-like protein [Blastocladiella britannica]